jgi:RNA polymerase-binding transcription factor DksA
MSPSIEPGVVARALVEERARTAAQAVALSRDFDSVVESCEQDAYDDEHDPEGHTIAFERQQVAALLRDARSHLADLDAALARVEGGTYGTCEACRRPIAPERLAARPASRRCVTCAA